MAAQPERYELHFEDETHLDTNPYLSRVWHRIGTQPTLPAAGTNRRLTVFGSVEARGRGRIELLRCSKIRPGSPAIWRPWMPGTRRRDGRSSWCWTTVPAMSARPPRPPSRRGRLAGGHPPGPLQPAPQSQGARVARLKRDHRGHLASTLRQFVDAAAAGLAGLGGEECAIIDEVPQWWLDGHRKEPTGRPPGRPHGAKDRTPRARRAASLPARTRGCLERGHRASRRRSKLVVAR